MSRALYLVGLADDAPSSEEILSVGGFTVHVRRGVPVPLALDDVTASNLAAHPHYLVRLAEEANEPTKKKEEE